MPSACTRKKYRGGEKGNTEKLTVQKALNILGLNTKLNIEKQSEIKKAYRRKALEVHPNKGGKAEDFRKVQESYYFLKNIYELRKSKNKN